MVLSDVLGQQYGKETVSNWMYGRFAASVLTIEAAD